MTMANPKKTTPGEVIDLAEKSAASRRMRAHGVCPICGEKVVHEHRPFCSDRCRMRDLGHWLDESYRVAGDCAYGANASESDED